MGWTWYHAKLTWQNRRYTVDRKAECDRMLTQSGHEENGCWYPQREVLKSVMVGSTYYGAVKTTDKDGRSEVWAAVFLTQTNCREYMNFGYKDMDETCGPVECQCPKGILKLLTETDSEYAKGWRKRCMEFHEKEKRRRALERLSVGSKISFVNRNYVGGDYKLGEEIVLTKRESSGSKGKRTYWSSGKYRWSKKAIPDDYRIVA